MRIIFDNIVFTLQKAGGISVVWQELLFRFLKEQKDEICFLEHESDKLNIFRQMLEIPQVMIKVVSSRLFSIERYLNPTIKGNIPFIFHSSYFRTCNNKNAINVTTIHDFTYEYFYKNKRKGAFLHIWQRNRAISNSDAIVCISENTKRDLLKFVPNIPANKVHVIYNGVSADYQIIENKLLELSESILFVGARGAYKNGRWFVDAISKTNYNVIFCGRPLTDDEKKYYDKKLGPNRYKIYSNISNEELNRIYNSVKCLVYPSSYEGFGIPILEAQKAGCPVIALNSSSIPEVMGDSPLLMQRLTEDELYKKLALLENHVIRDKIIKKGLENSERFSWDITYKLYRNLYEKLLEQRGVSQ